MLDTKRDSAEFRLEMYRRMLRIRFFEEAAESLKRKGQLFGALHLSIGQEAAIVGAAMALHTDDYIVGTHRSHGHPIAKNAQLNPLMAELLGKRTGVCHGNGGSMHLADFSVGSVGETAIVGAGIPVAVGAAYTAKVTGSGRVALSFFGDGATNIGSFHEALNLASIWKAPVIFFCENNGYAITMRFEDASAAKRVSGRADSYSMPGVTVDGDDPEEVHRVVSDAVDRARGGGGPTLIEAITYRFRDHAEFGGLDLGYRTKEEVQERIANDPLMRYKTRLESLDEIGPERVADVERSVRADIDQAVEFALSSPVPTIEESLEDLYAS